MICHKCGYENLSGDNFCGNCGNRLEQKVVRNDYSGPRPMFTLQDSSTLRLQFQQAGYRFPTNSKVLSKISDILIAQRRYPVDETSEMVIAHLQVKCPRGLLSVLWSVLKYKTSVSVSWIDFVNAEGKCTWSCQEGELVLTNCRILIFQQTANAAEYSIGEVWLEQIKLASFDTKNENILILEIRQ